MKLLFAIALLTACQQDKAERCQSTSDCASGLSCNLATQLCQDKNGDQIDATLPIDAPADAFVPDAPLDAPADAMIDAP